MENAIIIVILAAALLLGVRAAVKHMRHESACCGGSSYKPRKKKLPKVVETKVLKVEGMHCEKCSNRVTEVINDIPNAAARVDLKSGTVTISCAEYIDEAILRAAIERAGYQVV